MSTKLSTTTKKIAKLGNEIITTVVTRTQVIPDKKKATNNKSKPSTKTTKKGKK